MKYILIGILLLIIATSCYEDLGNYDYGTKTAIQVDSIKSLYEAYSGDTLHITPEIISQKDIVEYEWSVYDSLKAVAEITILGNEKDLHYPVYLPQGIYQIVYKLTDIDGYTQIITSALNVYTTYSEGFYVLKEIEGNSDLDFYPTNADPMPDLILNLHEERLQGLPQGLFISPQHKYIDSTNQREFVLFPITEEEAPMFKVQDMSRVFEYEDMFYSPPIPKEQPQCFFYGSDNMFALLTEDHVYAYQTVVATVSGKFGDYANYKTEIAPAPYVAIHKGNFVIPSSVLFYDNLNGQFLNLSTFNIIGSYRNANLDESIPLVPPSGLNCQMIFMKQPKAGIGKAFAIMEHKENKERYLFSLDPSTTSYNPISSVDTLPNNLHIYEAEHFAVSENGIYIYYNVGTQLYYYDISTKKESSLNLDLEGEEICMLNYLYWTREPQWHKFIVATHSSGQYKLYLFDIRGDLPNTSISPTTHEGYGKPKAIHYVSPNSVFLNQYPYN